MSAEEDVDITEAFADVGPLEGGSRVLTMTATVPTPDEERQAHVGLCQRSGPMSKPIAKQWGAQPSGAVKEPGQRDASRGRPPAAELTWTYVGLSIIARTFLNAERMVLTTRTGPREQEIERRVIRHNATGRVIDDCMPENTSDADLRRELPRQLSIRVAFHLKDAVKMFVGKGADVAEVYLPPRLAEEAGLRKYGGQVLRPRWSLT